MRLVELLLAVVAAAALRRAPAPSKAESPQVPVGVGLNLTVDARLPGPPAGGLVLLRIQKTGTSTFGDRIMNRMCKLHNVPCDVYFHVDWNMISHQPLFQHRSVVTWIRDPVERIFSEFEYVKNIGADAQVQWDYTPAQRAAVKKIKTLEEFVNMPNNPANNRMARYLLGFGRPNLSCYRECDKKWNWFLNHGGVAPGAQMTRATTLHSQIEILTVVKSRMDFQVPLIGITDCYDASLTLLGTQMGWDVPMMLDMAKVHYRAGGSNSTAPVTKSHRAEITPALALLIEQKNAIDLQVYHYAKLLVDNRLMQFAPHVQCTPSLHPQGTATLAVEPKKKSAMLSK